MPATPGTKGRPALAESVPPIHNSSSSILPPPSTTATVPKPSTEPERVLSHAGNTVLAASRSPPLLHDAITTAMPSSSTEQQPVTSHPIITHDEWEPVNQTPAVMIKMFNESVKSGKNVTCGLLFP